jgi:hypothetical protein
MAASPHWRDAQARRGGENGAARNQGPRTRGTARGIFCGRFKIGGVGLCSGLLDVASCTGSSKAHPMRRRDSGHAELHTAYCRHRRRPHYHVLQPLLTHRIMSPLPSNTSLPRLPPLMIASEFPLWQGFDHLPQLVLWFVPCTSTPCLQDRIVAPAHNQHQAINGD